MAKPKKNKGSQRKPAVASSSATKKVDKSKRGCAISFLNEERGELDKECERTPEAFQEEYHQPDKEKEAGGEG